MIEANGFPITLNAYDQVLADIAETISANVSEEALLSAPHFELTYTSRFKITEIFHEKK